MLEVASTSFDPAVERIIDVNYPSVQDAVHVRHSILGDDSVLVKYLNPHIALISTLSTRVVGDAKEAGSSAEGSDLGDDKSSAEGSVMHWTLIDTVTGKVVLRLHQDSANLPTHSVIVENHIVTTYWNEKVSSIQQYLFCLLL